MQKICRRWTQIWTEGKTDLILSGYAWHNRWTYSPKKIDTYNELAWGGGIGREFYDEDGDIHALYALAFSDSHKNMEPVVGYVFLKTAHLTEHLNVGLGYTLLVTMRPDINHNLPFPGVLPWAAVNYRSVGLMATYIPGSRGAGNVLFICGKWTPAGA